MSENEKNDVTEVDATVFSNAGMLALANLLIEKKVITKEEFETELNRYIEKK